MKGTGCTMILGTDSSLANQQIKLEAYIDKLESNRYVLTQIIINGKTFYMLYDLKQKHEVRPTADHRWALQWQDGRYWLYSIKPVIRLIYDDEYCIDEIPDLNDGIHGEEKWYFLGDKYVGLLDNAHQTFLVSNYGRYKSYTDYYARIIQPAATEKGYLTVCLSRSNVRIKVRVHRPVAYYFLLPGMPEGTRFDGSDVHHKANKADNQEWNLEIVQDRALHRQLDKAKRAAEAARIAA